MDWPTVVVSVIGSTVAGTVAFLSSWSIERWKAQRSKELQETQNAFSIGASSHMAEVAFNKLISFSEAYMAAVSKARNAPLRVGKKDHPLATIDFFKIRQKYALWLSEDIEDK